MAEAGAFASCEQIPRAGLGPKSRSTGPNRVKGSSGPFNARRRRELEYGDMLNRACDQARRSLQIEDGE